jgi:ATP-dependent DNA helicase RecG
MNGSLPSALASPVQFVRGIGPKKAAALAQIGIHEVYDLFFYVPRRYLDRSLVVSIADLHRIVRERQLAPDSDLANSVDIRQDTTVVGEVRSFRVLGAGPKSRFVLVLSDRTGSLQCIWFGGVPYWRKAFRVGEILAVSGQPTLFSGVVQFIHPDFDRLAAPEAPGAEETDWREQLNTGRLVPLYPTSQELVRAGLDSGGFRRALQSTLRMYLDRVPESLPRSLLRGRDLIGLPEAIRAVHFPHDQQDLQAGLTRLKYEELFSFQLKLALRRHAVGREAGVSFSTKSPRARQLSTSLPFALTRAQIRVLREISADMASGHPMNRLLQGDVGSGKTVVALFSLLCAADNGYQAAFMAPTEILAEQHFKTLTSFLKDIPLNVRLLVGAQRSRLRMDLLEEIRRGSADVVVGTHALFEKQVEFRRLGLVIIDEQHRFGVLQRARVRQKGVNPHVLVMTATPIPRTLSLTLYGDLEVSILDEMPKDRRPVKTILKHDQEKESVFQFVREQVQAGRQAYFVYPLIEESEKVELKAAAVHFEELSTKVFPDLRLGLIHGRLPSEEKDRIMASFRRREIDILVATTVIEVGIDVPNASVMVIEDAERFGLSQLHQLRGRVGRGNDQSYCLLLAKPWIARRAGRMGRLGGTLDRTLPLTVDQERLAEKRLAAMVSTNDGFQIAEYDLQLRGPGDFFGTRQSGLPAFNIADILADSALLDAARADAFALVERDPHLKDPEHRVLAEYLRTRFRDQLEMLQVG